MTIAVRKDIVGRKSWSCESVGARVTRWRHPDTMFPFRVFMSETSAADLLAQVRWRDGLQCPRCRSESVIKYGSYREFQWYRCKGCDRTFNDKTETIFAHAKVALRKLLFALYVFWRFNTSIRQIGAELDVSYRSLRPGVERFTRALDAPSFDLVGPVEIDELYVTAGMKGRELDRPSRSRGLSIRGRGTYHEDKPPLFILVYRGTDKRYVIPGKSADESTIRLLLENHDKESLTVYTDGFRAYEPLEQDDAFDRKYVVHGDGEYADEDGHVNTCKSYGSLVRPWLSPHRGISKDKLTPDLRSFQLRRQLFRKPGKEALRHALRTVL